jgi:ligand-binding sensor domain-containing protein
VVGLFEDSKGNLWAGVKDGIWRWKPGTSNFYPVPAAGGTIQSFPLPGVVFEFQAAKLLRDRQGSLCIATLDHGRIHLRGGRADAFSRADGLSGDTITGLFEDREGSVWVTTNEGLDRFHDLSVHTFTRVKVCRIPSYGLFSPTERGAFGSGLWADWRNGTTDKLPSSASTGLRKRRSTDPTILPNSLFQDHQGRIWVSTNRALGCLEEERFVPVSGIPDASIYSVVEDKAGNLWIASQNNGLLRWYPTALLKFHAVTYMLGDRPETQKALE